MPGPVFKKSGFLRVATIKRVDLSHMVAYISFRDSVIGTDDRLEYSAQLPISYLSADGGFIGGAPAAGTPVVVGQAEGSNAYFIVAFLFTDPAARVSTSSINSNLPTVLPNTITIQANMHSSITLDTSGIVIGDYNNSISVDVNRGVSLNSFDDNYVISQGSREINGLIRRDKKPNNNFNPASRAIDISYNDALKIIGMDPESTTNVSNSGSYIRNPSRIEKRETVFEYESIANVKSNEDELEFYKTGNPANDLNIINRREMRTDALSLSLVSPNYLMETIKGTAVDLFGNIIDINRNIIPIGKDVSSSVAQIKTTTDNPATLENIYEQIKRLERKSLAYHFEINARKELNGSAIPNVDNIDNYARQRSRFFFDVDKEGQFKLNVPASSETGNISLNTRYENFSTVFPNDSSNNPNDLNFNDDYRDILTEPFLTDQPITLKDSDGKLTGPMDRLSDTDNIQYIGHGTVYHDISKTCSSMLKSSYYEPTTIEFEKTTSKATFRLPKTFIVSDTIITSGPNANAGGRSGSMNFDGSVEINIGANTVDRQSLWLDLQGGAIMNIGRDLRNISLAANLDGEVLVQIGGETPNNDNRFKEKTTTWTAGALEIRVADSNTGEYNIFRIDNEGISISAPSRISLYCNDDLTIRNTGTMRIDSPNLLLNGRQLLENPGQGAIR